MAVMLTAPLLSCYAAYVLPLRCVLLRQRLLPLLLPTQALRPAAGEQGLGKHGGAPVFRQAPLQAAADGPDRYDIIAAHGRHLRSCLGCRVKRAA